LGVVIHTYNNLPSLMYYKSVIGSLVSLLFLISTLEDTVLDDSNLPTKISSE
jgi:lipid-A-disaccharide synthase-like uncharacterized protein